MGCLVAVGMDGVAVPPNAEDNLLVRSAAEYQSGSSYG